MAGFSNNSASEYVLKKGGNDVPVDACKGWFDPCEYCDKRFGEWVPVDEDVYEKIPDKPGFFMIALKNKNSAEVVSILCDQTTIQRSITTTIDEVKSQISNKKNKASKSAMLVRWMVPKKIYDKENCIICAHWINNGTLPKFLNAWPGQSLMEKSDAVVFSNHIQKWCYPQKNPTWRKPKPPSSKNIEMVKKCTWESCEICDSNFTKWLPISKAVDKEIPPEDKGVVMFSASAGKEREVVLLRGHEKDVTSPIHQIIKEFSRYEHYYVTGTKLDGKNPRLEVRWMVIKDVNCDNSCFMFAHWFNAEKYPRHNDYFCIPGETSLNINKHFVFRTNDKKWFYETAALKPQKNNKAKDRRRLLDELEDGLYDDEHSKIR